MERRATLGPTGTPLSSISPRDFAQILAYVNGEKLRLANPEVAAARN
jgi:hypothetical protein